ncbi:MAG: hypothetical protein AAF666_12705 [Pseudomonadota bacterium]
MIRAILVFLTALAAHPGDAAPLTGPELEALMPKIEIKRVRGWQVFFPDGTWHAIRRNGRGPGGTWWVAQDRLCLRSSELDRSRCFRVEAIGRGRLNRLHELILTGPDGTRIIERAQMK